jgi:hypothetical protein
MDREKKIKKKYKILCKHKDINEKTKKVTIYYIVKRKKRGLTMKEVINTDVFE